LDLNSGRAPLGFKQVDHRTI
jgi:hypothetical protein